MLYKVNVISKGTVFNIPLAWDLVVSLMCKGEICLVNTSPRFAYGEFGRYAILLEFGRFAIWIVWLVIENLMFHPILE